jgi:hypothetical protein
MKAKQETLFIKANSIMQLVIHCNYVQWSCSWYPYHKKHWMGTFLNHHIMTLSFNCFITLSHRMSQIHQHYSSKDISKTLFTSRICMILLLILDHYELMPWVCSIVNHSLQSPSCGERRYHILTMKAKNNTENDYWK